MLNKWLIDNVEIVDKPFKSLNIVVDVGFKLLIDNVESVDRLFKFVVVAYTDILVHNNIVVVNCIELSVIKLDILLYFRY